MPSSAVSAASCHFAFIYLTGATLRIRDLGWQQAWHLPKLLGRCAMLSLIFIVVRVFAVVVVVVAVSLVVVVVILVVFVVVAAGFSHHGKEHFDVAAALRRRLSSPFGTNFGCCARTHMHTHEA